MYVVYRITGNLKYVYGYAWTLNSYDMQTKLYNSKQSRVLYTDEQFWPIRLNILTRIYEVIHREALGVKRLAPLWSLAQNMKYCVSDMKTVLCTFYGLQNTLFKIVLNKIKDMQQSYYCS